MKPLPLLLLSALAAFGGRAAPPAATPVVIASRLAGGWYAADPATLRAELQAYLAAAPAPATGQVRALILPHAGYRFSGAVAAHGYRRVAGQHPDRVLVLGPSHRIPLPHAASLPAAAAYETPLGGIAIDTACVAALRSASPRFVSVPAAHDGEHSTEIHLPFLQIVFPGVPVVPIVVGQLDAASARDLAAALRGLLTPRTLVIASTDFTHYGPNYDYVPFTERVPERLRELDLGAYAFIEQRDVEGFLRYCQRTGATVCGRDPVAVLLALLADDVPATLLQYDTSGRLTGDFQNSVSYLAAAFAGRWSVPAAEPLSAADQAALLRLARAALERHYAPGPPATPDQLGVAITPGLRRVMGAFVTLTRDHELRGCIGEILPRRPLCEAVAARAVDAAVRDQRFPPVTSNELAGLRVEISALTPPRPVADFEEIEVGRHGVLLTKGDAGAVFLPQVATEQGWDRDTMLSQLARKAGLPADAWRTGATFEVFEAQVFGEAR